MQRHLLLAIVLMWFGAKNNTMAQDFNTQNPKQSIGFMVGMGSQSNLNVNYIYHAKYFQFQYYCTFLSEKFWGLTYLLQPQYNVTKFRDLDGFSGEIHGFETGITMGMLVYVNILPLNKAMAYAGLAFGPHYVSETPKKQANGFVLSDNCLAGFIIKLHENLAFDLRYGFRHFSNAKLKKPNGGVDEFVWSGGLVWNL